MPPVLTPSAIATMEPMPSCPGSGSMAAQKSSLMSLRPASDAKPMSRSNAMHQDKQVSCLILVHRSKPPGNQQQYCNPEVAEQNESDGFVPRARRQAAAKAIRLRKGCNAAMGAKTRFHVSIFP